MEVPGYVLHLGCGRRGRKTGEVEAGTGLLGLGGAWAKGGKGGLPCPYSPEVVV